MCYTTIVIEMLSSTVLCSEDAGIGTIYQELMAANLHEKNEGGDDMAKVLLLMSRLVLLKWCVPIDKGAFYRRFVWLVFLS